MRVDYKIPKSTKSGEKNTCRNFSEKLDFSILTIFPEPYKAQKNPIIFRFIKFFENFQNGRRTQIFWFLETSMEVEYKIPKSKNFSEKNTFKIVSKNWI